ncbi:unnamed protein product [Trichogramma brassicae]|uniref:Uncharacterized protein n=1 Tax=Trichogramma brassicae TaxID=86971 RepID=A0A6H5IVA8_9HYME|nr:unnamed protein product [Trichogramma brassicae]
MEMLDEYQQQDAMQSVVGVTAADVAQLAARHSHHNLHLHHHHLSRASAALHSLAGHHNSGGGSNNASGGGAGGGSNNGGTHHHASSLHHGGGSGGGAQGPVVASAGGAGGSSATTRHSSESPMVHRCVRAMRIIIHRFETRATSSKTQLEYNTARAQLCARSCINVHGCNEANAREGNVRIHCHSRLDLVALCNDELYHSHHRDYNTKGTNDGISSSIAASLPTFCILCCAIVVQPRSSGSGSSSSSSAKNAGGGNIIYTMLQRHHCASCGRNTISSKLAWRPACSVRTIVHWHVSLRATYLSVAHTRTHNNNCIRCVASIGVPEYPCSHTYRDNNFMFPALSSLATVRFGAAHRGCCCPMRARLARERKCHENYMPKKGLKSARVERISLQQHLNDSATSAKPSNGTLILQILTIPLMLILVLYTIIRRGTRCLLAPWTMSSLALSHTIESCLSFKIRHLNLTIRILYSHEYAYKSLRPCVIFFASRIDESNFTNVSFLHLHEMDLRFRVFNCKKTIVRRLCVARPKFPSQF